MLYCVAYHRYSRQHYPQRERERERERERARERVYYERYWVSTNEQYAHWSCLPSLSFPNTFSSPPHSVSTLAAIRLAASAQRRCFPKGRCAYPPSFFCCALWSCLLSLSSPTIFSSALCIPIPSVSPVCRKKIICTVLFLLLKKISCQSN